METSIPCNQVLSWPSSQWTKTTALQAATQKFFSTLQESMVSEQWNIGKHETRSSCLSAGSWFSFEMCQVWTFTLKIQLQKNPEVFQKMLQNFSVAWPKRLLEHGRGTTLFAIPPLCLLWIRIGISAPNLAAEGAALPFIALKMWAAMETNLKTTSDFTKTQMLNLTGTSGQ